jgi:hypothetical protein
VIVGDDGDGVRGDRGDATAVGATTAAAEPRITTGDSASRSTTEKEKTSGEPRRERVDVAVRGRAALRVGVWFAPAASATAPDPLDDSDGGATGDSACFDADAAFSSSSGCLLVVLLRAFERAGDCDGDALRGGDCVDVERASCASSSAANCDDTVRCCFTRARSAALRAPAAHDATARSSGGRDPRAKEQRRLTHPVSKTRAGLQLW